MGNPLNYIVMLLYIYEGIRNRPLVQVKYQKLIFFNILVGSGQNRVKIQQLVKKKSQTEFWSNQAKI